MGKPNYAHFRDEFNFWVGQGYKDLETIARMLGIKRESLVTRIKRYGLTDTVFDLVMTPRRSGRAGASLAYVLKRGARLPERPIVPPIKKPGAPGEASAVYGRGQGPGTLPPPRKGTP